ncbi:MAG: carbohydrate binding domain-containing protein, partial [Clostridia bacterium]|nr:carbohydrate binding domain-containing protein [Clostridia bacterium]
MKRTFREFLVLVTVFAMVASLLPVGTLSAGATSANISPAALGQYFMRYNMSNSTRLIDMYMLGAHDAFTSGLNSSSAVDSAGVKLGDIGATAARLIWTSSIINRSRAQDSNTTEMLNSGVRYFDARLSRSTEGGEWWTTHGRLSDQFSGDGGIAQTLAAWLAANPGEIVVLDIQSVFDIETDDGSATTTSWGDIAAALDSAGLLSYVYTRNGSVSSHTYGSLTNNGTRAACVLFGQATGSWTSYNGEYYFINRRDSDGYVRSLWTEESSLADVKTALAAEATTADSSSYNWKLRVMQAQTTGSNLVSDANTNNYSILTDANFEAWNSVLRVFQVDNATSDTNNFNSLALNALAEKNRPDTIVQNSNDVSFSAPKANIPFSSHFEASSSDPDASTYSNLTSVNSTNVLAVRKVFDISLIQGASTAVSPTGSVTIALPTDAVASDKAAAVVKYDNGSYTELAATESLTSVSFSTASVGTYLLVELDAEKPDGAKRAAAVPSTLDVSVDDMAQNATLEFDGSYANVGSVANDTPVASAPVWSDSWVTTATANINLINDGTVSCLQVYGNSGYAELSSVASGGFASGKGYYYLQFRATRSSNQWHDIALMDATGNYFATFCFANDGLFPDDAKRSFNNTPSALTEVGDLSASTDGLWYRIYVRNVIDSDTQAEYYVVSFATSSTADGTYAVYNTLTYQGSVNGFGGFYDKIGGADPWWNNIRFGDFQIYSGDFDAYAPITVNLTCDGTTFATSEAYAFIGATYAYSPEQTYYNESTGNYYKLLSAPEAIVVADSGNSIAVEYLKLGAFDLTQNLITNGGFEDGAANFTTSDFSTAITDGSNGFAISTDVYRSGAQSLYQGTGTYSSSAGSLSTKWAVTPGKTYVFTFYAYAAANASYSNAYVQLLPSSGTTANSTILNPIVASTLWYKNSVVFTAGDADAYVGVKVGWASGVYYDDFSLYEYSPDTTSATIKYISTETGDYLVGTPTVELAGFVSGAAGSVDGLIVGESYTYSSTSPIVLEHNNVSSTYIYDSSVVQITSIDTLMPDAAQNNIVLYYREAAIIAAEYNGASCTTRVGIAPTLPTVGAANIWLEGSDTTGEPDGTADVIWGAVDVTTTGQKLVTGTVLGYSGTVTATVTVVALDSFLLVEYDFDDETLADT